ncbi:MAG: flagellar hook capping FlgD N-terminal domain-containing protein [Pseudomonadota bacterium]
METTPVSATNTPAPSRSEPAAPENSADALSSDFETFLNMLTAQLENQDPLNPVESTDFAVQLATFSGVEQQVKTNDLLEAMITDDSLGGLTDIAEWVGQEARAPVAAHFSGSPMDLYLDLPAAADQATLTVRDAAGSVVTQIAIPSNVGTYTWDGTDAGGATVAEGQYSFTVDTRASGAFLKTVQPEVYTPVVEARLENGAPVLVVEGGETIPVTSVTGVRRGDAP